MIGSSEPLCRTSSFERANYMKMPASHVRSTKRSRGTRHLERELPLRWIVSMIYLASTILIVVLLLSWLTPGSLAQTQTLAPKKSQTKSEKKTDESKAKLSEADLLEAQRRAFAISLLMSLADEARSYRDLALRPRVLARAADMLWDADSDAARTQFRRAWEAAERADAEEVTTPQTKDGFTGLVICIKEGERWRPALGSFNSGRTARPPTWRGVSGKTH